MPMQYKPRSEFRKKIGALGRKQNAAARILLDREGRNEQCHLCPPGLDSGDGLRNLPNRLDGRVTDQTLHRYVVRNLHPSEYRAARHYDGTPVSGRGGGKVAFYLFDRLCGRQLKIARRDDETMRWQTPQSVAAKLNSGEIPPGCETMVSVGEEERLRIQTGLQIAYAARICHAPDLVQTAEPVGRFDVRSLAYRQQRCQSALRIVTPQPQTAGVAIWVAIRIAACRLQHVRACGNTIGKSLFMRENGGFGSVEQTHNAVAKGLAAFAGKTEALVVKKQSGLPILNQRRITKRERRLFTGHIERGAGRMESPKGQDDRHLGDHIRVTVATA